MIAADFSMLDHLERQRKWSEETFGPGRRTKGIISHICKELEEIEAAPDDLMEWIDGVILCLDGAWRTGATSEQIINALVAKQRKNEAREWPNWRDFQQDEPIEHIR